MENNELTIFSIEKNDQELYGLKDSKENVVVPAVYEDISKKGASFICEDADGKQGVLDKNGKLVIPVEYDYITMERDFFICRDTDYKEGVFYKNGKVVIPVEYEGIREEDGLFICEDANNRVGVLDGNGKVVIPVEYDGITKEDDFFICVDDDGKRGVLDTNGKVVIPIEYRYISKKSDSFICENAKEKYGVLNPNGTEIIPFVYKEIKGIYDTKDFLKVQKGKKVGVIRTDGTELLPIEYDEIRGDSSIHIEVRKNKKVGLLRKTDLSVVLPVEYDEIDEYNNADSMFKNVLFLIVKKQGKRGIVSTDGKELVPCVYDMIKVGNNQEELIVKKGGKYKCLNLKNGNFLSDLPSDKCCVYTPDGTGILQFLTNNPVIPPTVKTCEKDLVRGELDKITFEEGCTELRGWGFDYLDTIDHDGYIPEIVLPSTINKIDKSFFDDAGIGTIWVPKGMKEYFEGIVPFERMKDRIREME